MLARLLPDPDDRASFRRWALIALALYVIAAIFTEGWYAYDEHWQIIEFASEILGRARPADMAWEFAARARPSLQPFLYAGIERVLLDGGLSNPFTLATIFRLVSALAAWVGTVAMALAAARWFPASPVRRWVLPALALAWFGPYLHARTSSENAAETAFLLGFAILALSLASIDGERAASRRRLPLSPALGAGMLFGLAFEFRYQVGLMVAGACLWCALIGRVQLRGLGLMVAGMVVAIAIGTLADRFFYGEWTFAPWNYFRVNIVEHKASSYGTAPWWAYLPLMFERIGPPLSLLVVPAVFFAWVRRPRSLVTWSMVPFLVVHMILGHKEFRFLYPLATLSILVAVRSVDDARLMWPELWKGISRFRWSRALVAIVIAEDLILLAIASVRPSQATMPLYRHVYGLAGRPLTIFYREEQPYQFGPDLQLRFYEPPGLTLTRVSSYADFDQQLEHGDAWFVLRGFELPDEAGDLPRRCAPTFRTMPTWVREVNVNHWVDRTPVWTLFRCSGGRNGQMP